jgi:hypothetical protein
MKSTTRLLVLAFIASFGFYSCSESPLKEPTSPSKPAVAPAPAHISKVADFKMILPKGNQIVADGVDMLFFKFLFLDKEGKAITSHEYWDYFLHVTVNGKKDVLFRDAIKSNQLGTYDISITINGITKSYPVVATTAEKKIVEIPIIFNFVSTDYSDKVVEVNLKNLVDFYKKVGLDNVIFKLAEIDNDGTLLKRKGVKFWNYKAEASDGMDYKSLWPKNKFAINVYLLKNTVSIAGMPAGRSSAYGWGDLIVINRIDQHIDLNTFGFWQLTHEMGHILGLADVYDKYDGSCKVQDGVSDIEGFNSKTVKINIEKDTYISNCGNEFSYSNIMASGDISKRSSTMTLDQLKIAKKTALTLKF